MTTNTTPALPYGLAIDGTVTADRFETPGEAVAASRLVRAANPGRKVAPVDVAKYLAR